MPKFGRPSGLERQARLKPQYASLYPGVVAGEWIPAWVLAEQLMNTAERRGVVAGERVRPGPSRASLRWQPGPRSSGASGPGWGTGASVRSAAEVSSRTPP